MTCVRRMRPVLGCFVEIGVADAERHATEASVLHAIDAAYIALQRIHNAMSLFDANSELMQLNAAPLKWHYLSCDLYRVLRLACGTMRLTSHQFNCTVGGLLLAQSALPRLTPLDYLPVGHVDDFQWRGQRLRLRRPLYITLDGIAKGYAVDCAVRELKRHSIASGWVNAGGDLRVFGEYRLAIIKREADASLTPLGYLHNAAMASSQWHGSANEMFPAQLIVVDAKEENAPTFSQHIRTVVAARAWRADALTKVMPISDASYRAAFLNGAYACAA